jgi:hypothetical protein
MARAHGVKDQPTKVPEPGAEALRAEDTPSREVQSSRLHNMLNKS